ncbi:proteasome alpha 3 subunit [Novymonas esmeraldas]|uniref:Proteasome subunit alpha type n=1 Tax=Novymonas esmeraldas TaxID=1808958 RepID=A0AAW0EPA6_9TRYP
MSHRYDSRTTTFSPEGRLYQVEYAVEAIQQAGTVIGVTTKEGVVLAGETMAPHPLFDSENMQDKNTSGEKVYKIAEHIGCSVAGVTSDAYALLNYARLTAHRHQYAFQEPMAIEDLCRTLCDEKQLYTQYGGVRPYGVSLLLAGWDRYYGYQLYSTEPSGDYSAWSAYAIGQNDQVAQSLLKKDWREGMSLHDGMLLALRVLSKTMDTAKIDLSRVEMAVLHKVPASSAATLLDPFKHHAKTIPQFHIISRSELKPHAERADKAREAEEQAEAERERQQEQALGS